MIKKLAWNTFKNTGNINTFLELMEVENIEKSMLSSNVDNKNVDTKNITENTIVKDIYGNNKN